MKKKSLDKKSGRQGRKKQTSLEWWVAWLLFLALFFIFLFIFGDNGLLQIGELRRVRMALSVEINKLNRENEEIRKEIRGLREDSYYIEKVAREELNLVRPNEVVYQIIPSSEEKSRGK